MKKYFVLIFLLLHLLSFSQPQSDLKRDYQWILGYNVDLDMSKAVIFDFNHDSLELLEATKPIPISYSYAGLCNEEGKLMLYSNGCSIADGNQQVIPYGDTINFSGYWDGDCNGSIPGYELFQGVLMLPVPNRSDQVYVFHKPLRDTELYDGVTDVLFLTKVQKNLANQWEVVQKDSPILEALTLPNGLTACRHANGRDWWILMPKGWNTNRYYRWLLTEGGLSGPFSQEIGDDYPTGRNDVVSFFSPDGSKYVLDIRGIGINIFDFDRCTGTLSNPIKFPHNVWAVDIMGAAISPNSRYLYLTSVFYLWQYDLWAEDILSSKTLVAEYDNFYNIYEAAFFGRAQLAPDGKIYINASEHGKRVMHVIENPDSAGVACNFVQHKVILPIYAFGLPQYPNFRLGSLAGSPCDTLTAVIDKPSSEGYSFSVSPNPAADRLVVENLSDVNEGIIFRIYNAQGILMSQSGLQGDVTRQIVNTSAFPSGFYFYEFSSKEKIIDTGKIVILHE